MATGITEQDVHTAADALLLEGQRPTIERVRLHLGRGSPNTITGFLNSWFEKLGQRLQGSSTPLAAPPDPVLHLAGQTWQAAQELATAMVAAQHQAATQSLLQTRQELDSEQAQLALAREQLAMRAMDLEAGAQLAREQLSASEERLLAAETRLRECDARITVLQEQLVSGESERAALHAAAQAQHSAHEQALQAAQARHAAHEHRWMLELDGERSSLKQLRSELESARKTALQDSREAAKSIQTLESTITDAAHKATQQQQKIAAQQEQLISRESVLAQMRQAATDALENLRRTELAAAPLQTQIKLLETQLLDLREQNTGLAAQLLTKDGQIAALLNTRMAQD